MAIKRHTKDTCVRECVALKDVKTDDRRMSAIEIPMMILKRSRRYATATAFIRGEYVYALRALWAICILYECENKMRNNARIYGEFIRTRRWRVQRTSCNIATSLLNQVIEPRDLAISILYWHIGIRTNLLITKMYRLDFVSFKKIFYIRDYSISAIDLNVFFLFYIFLYFIYFYMNMIKTIFLLFDSDSFC